MKKFISAVSVFVSTLVASLGIAQAQTLTIQPIPAVLISFQGNPGTSYTIQASTNLSDTNAWVDIATLPANGTGFYSYSNFASGSAQFYRTVALPGGGLISLDPSSPNAQTVAVTDTVNGNYLGLPVLVFDVLAQSQSLNLKSLDVSFNVSGTNGSITAAYLYQGSTLITSAAISYFPNPTANFGLLGSPISIPVGNVLPLTIKVDVSGVGGNGNGLTVSANVNPIAVGLQDAYGNDVVANGSAQGNPITVVGEGAAFSLADAPEITKVNITQGGSTNTMFKYTATFNVNVIAVGENIVMGLQQSIYPAFLTRLPYVAILKDGAEYIPNPYNVVAGYSAPSGAILLSGMATNMFEIPEGASFNIPVTYSWTITGATADTYAVQLQGINWSTTDGTPYVWTIPDPENWTTLSE